MITNVMSHLCGINCKGFWMKVELLMEIAGEAVIGFM
jgi:hypothetical protein